VITKTIVNKKLPFYLVPVRFLYRKIASRLFKNVRLIQIERDSIKYLLWANEDVGKRMILQGGYEQSELLAFRKLIRNDDICIDVGGNVGIFSLNFAKCCGEHGHVYVIEPMRKNQLVIELAAEINGLKNMSVFRYALSDRDGEVTLEIPSADGAYAYIKSNHDKSGSEQLSVRCLPLGKFVNEQAIQKIDVLKIDVEGAEKLVLDGGKEIFLDNRRKPRVLMVELVDEFLGRFGATVLGVLAMMSELGYEPYYAQSNGELLPFDTKDINQIFNVFFLHRGS
jgi:FkbM family methyltransferase